MTDPAGRRFGGEPARRETRAAARGGRRNRRRPLSAMGGASYKWGGRRRPAGKPGGAEMAIDRQEDSRGAANHHDGTSDATPGGYARKRRPGEAGFALFLLLASLFLLWQAYGISGFEALSAPGTVPMATTAVMAVSALIILIRTWPKPRVSSETLARDILPLRVVVLVAMLVGFGLALKPVGFLPSAALFLILAIKYLARRGWGFTLAVSLGGLAAIWLIFRIVFTVLLPAGIVPEAEFIQLFRDLLGGGR